MIKVHGRKTFFDIEQDSGYVPTRTYNCKHNPDTDALCEHAWLILMQCRHDGLTIWGLLSRVRYDGFKVSDQLDITLEKRGFLLWLDGNRLKPYRHPDGTFVEYEDAEVDRQMSLGMAGVG